jgi:hypothetical protein
VSARVPENQTLVQFCDENVVADDDDVRDAFGKDIRRHRRLLSTVPVLGQVLLIDQVLRNVGQGNAEPTEDLILHKVACPYADILIALSSSAGSIVTCGGAAAPFPSECLANRVVIAPYRIFDGGPTPVMFDDLSGFFDLGMGDVLSGDGFGSLNGAFEGGRVEMVDVDVGPFLSETFGLALTAFGE